MLSGHRRALPARGWLYVFHWLLCASSAVGLAAPLSGRAQYKTQIVMARDDSQDAKDKTHVCAAPAMDVRVLPPIDSTAMTGVHALPIEFTNIGAEACRLPLSLPLTEQTLAPDEDR